MPTQEQQRLIEQYLRQFASQNPGVNPLGAGVQPGIQAGIQQSIDDNERFKAAVSQFASAYPTPSPFRSDQSQYAIAYGVQQFGTSAASAYAQQNRGVFLTPEQQAQSTLGILPAIGTIGGAVAGTFAGQPVLGAAIGGGAGSVIQSVAGANLEREQSSRLTAESLSSILGSATESIQRFKAAIEATGVPVQQLAAGLSTLAGNAPGITSASVTSAGRAATALGSFYEQDTTQISGFLASNPVMFRGREAYSRDQGGYSSQALQGVATIALFQGDIATYNTSRRDAARMANPEAARISDELTTLSGREAYNLRHMTWNDFIQKTFHPSDALTAADRTQAWADKQLSATDEQVKLSDTIMGWRGSLSFGANQLSKSQSDLQNAYLRGDSPSTIRSLVSNNVATSTTTLRTADQGLITALTGQIPGLEAAYKNAVPGSTAQAAASSALSAAYDLLNQYQAQSNQADTAQQQAIRGSTLYGIETTGAAYELGITRSTLGGASYASMRGAVTSQAAFLRGQAASGQDLSPAERDQLRVQAMQMVYANQMQGYAQTEAGIGVGIAQAGVGVARAQGYGDPSSVFKAVNVELDQRVKLENQLSEELRKGNLTADDRIQKEKQLADVQASVVSGRAAAVYNQLVGNESIQADAVAGVSALNPRNVRLSGSGAYDTAVTSGLTAQYQLYYNGARTAPNAEERARQQRLADETLAQLRSEQDFQRSVTPPAAMSTALSNAMTAYTVAGNLPFVGGQASNPYSQGGRVIGAIDAELSYAAAQRRRLQASGQWDAIAENNYAAFTNPLIAQRSEFEKIRMSAAEMSLVQMHEGQGPASIAAASGANARAAFYNPNTWLSGTPGRARPENGYGYSHLGSNSSQGFMDMAHGSAGNDGSAAVVAVLNRILIAVSSKSNPAQLQKSGAVSSPGYAIAQRTMNPYGN